MRWEFTCRFQETLVMSMIIIIIMIITIQT